MEILNSYIVVVSVLIMLFMANIEGYTFYAGGRDGWVVNPSESYGDWAQRNRFQVNDNIVFRYNQGQNSVLQVSKQDYDSCNVNNPIQKLGPTFTFPAPGPFYFISGNPDNCNKGQKLHVIVLSPRGPTTTNPSSPPIPVLSSPPTSPESPATVLPPTSLSPAGVTITPAGAAPAVEAPGPVGGAGFPPTGALGPSGAVGLLPGGAPAAPVGDNSSGGCVLSLSMGFVVFVLGCVAFSV